MTHSRRMTYYHIRDKYNILDDLIHREVARLNKLYDDYETLDVKYERIQPTNCECAIKFYIDEIGVETVIEYDATEAYARWVDKLY